MLEGPQVDQVKALYKEAGSPWPIYDPWHTYTQEVLDNTTAKWLRKLSLPNEAKVLNAGSGTTRYDLSCHVYDNDITDAFLVDAPNPIVASVDSLPVSDGFFNVGICVGSVINYCDALRAISELSRVIEQGGCLILEFERSDSAEFLFTKRHHDDVFAMTYPYNSQEHVLWLYSERYIERALRYNGLQIKHRKTHLRHRPSNKKAGTPLHKRVSGHRA